MKRSGFLMALVAGCYSVSLAAAAAPSEKLVYGKVGDKVVLKPDSVPGIITSITWKDDPNIAMDWDGRGLDSYRQFKDRADLNTSTGEMTIPGLTLNDGLVYKVEINGQEVMPPIRLIVLYPVPVPTVKTSCKDDNTSCTLTCQGNTTGAEPVTYTWKSDDIVKTDLTREQVVTKEESSSIQMFSCEMINPVSRESSQTIPNPFKTDDTPSAPVMQPKTIAGLVVFVSLLTSVLLVVGIHRWKAGMWFFEKASMPWEADFWKNEKNKPRASANDTTQGEQIEVTESLMK